MKKMRGRPDFLLIKKHRRQDLLNKMHRRPDFLDQVLICVLCAIDIVYYLFFHITAQNLLLLINSIID